MRRTDKLKTQLKEQNVEFSIIDRDIKILYEKDDEWILVHPSNTEPIIRIIVEAVTESRAIELCEEMKQKINSIMKD